MRVAIIHSFYSDGPISGENVVVHGQFQALTEKGHEVKLFSKYTEKEQSKPFYKLRSAFRVATGFGFNFRHELNDFNPDLVLVHNLFPNISSRWLEKTTIRRIVFVHNFRPWCSNGMLLRNGKHCQKCIRNRVWGTIFRCSDGSVLRSLIQGLGQVFNNYLNRLEMSGATIVAVSEVAQKKINEFDTLSRLGVLSNFLSVRESQYTRKQNEYSFSVNRFVWTGRISREKGLAELLNIWPPNYYLDIFGSGPDMDALIALHKSNKNITFLGSIPNANLREQLPAYLGLVNSSTWFETGPMTVIEALSAGLPIIFPKSLPIGKLIETNHAGVSYSLRDSDSLAIALTEISVPANRLSYAQSSQQLFMSQFSSENWYKSLIEICGSL